MYLAVIESAMPQSPRGWSRRLDLASLQLFAALCHHGSIGKTAKHEFIAASALSKRLSDLEAAVGTALFYREARGVRLTPAGEILRQHADVLLHSMDRMQAALQEYAHGAKGQVRLSASISATIQFLPEDLATFAGLYRDIRISLQERLNADVVRSVQDGSADLGVCQGQVIGEGVQSRCYRRDRLVLAVPTSHPLAERASIAFVESLDFDHIGLQEESAIAFAMRRAAFSAGKQLRTRLHVRSLEALCRMVETGHGIGLMPDHAFTLLHRPEKLRSVELTDEWAGRDVLLIAREFSSLPITARLLVDHLLRAE